MCVCTSITRSRAKSQCAELSTSMTPHRYARPRTVRPSGVRTVCAAPTTANGERRGAQEPESSGRALRLGDAPAPSSSYVGGQNNVDALEGGIRRDLQEVSATVMDAQELLRLRSSVMV